MEYLLGQMMNDPSLHTETLIQFLDVQGNTAISTLHTAIATGLVNLQSDITSWVKLQATLVSNKRIIDSEGQ